MKVGEIGFSSYERGRQRCSACMVCRNGGYEYAGCFLYSPCTEPCVVVFGTNPTARTIFRTSKVL